VSASQRLKKIAFEQTTTNAAVIKFQNVRG